VNYNWQARPSSLKVKVWHNIGNVTTTKYSSAIPEGSPDQASIYVCIIDWDSRHNVTSGADTPTGVWSPENGLNSVSEGEVLGYGIIYPQGQTSGSEMVETEIPIVWYDTTKKPSKNYTLILASASSRYGDYMNGCNKNVMYVDDFRWAY
ncbi:MAG: PCMD domain-containing protein, partial [Alistipes sp.]|nr:PCMD domain-containing protein [Alistipes sp.]